MSMSTSPRSSAPASSTRQQLDDLDALLQRMLELPVNQVEEIPPADAPAPQAAAPAPPPEETAPPPAIQPDADPDRIPLPPMNYPPSFMTVETVAPRLDPPHAAPTLRLEMLRRDPAAELPPQESPDGSPGEATAAPPDPPGFVWMQPDAESPPAAGPAEAEEWVPLRSSWQPSEQTWQPLADSWQQARTPRAPESEPPPEPVPETPEPSVAPENVFRFTPETPEPASAEAPAAPEPAPVLPQPDRGLLEDLPASVSRRGGPLVWFDRLFMACLGPFGAPGRWLNHSAGRALLGGVGLLCLAAAVAVMVADGVGWWPW